MDEAIWELNAKAITEYVMNNNPMGGNIQADVAYALVNLKTALSQLFELTCKRDSSPTWGTTELDIITDQTLGYVFKLIESAECALLENVIYSEPVENENNNT